MFVICPSNFSPGLQHKVTLNETAFNIYWQISKRNSKIRGNSNDQIRNFAEYFVVQNFFCKPFIDFDLIFQIEIKTYSKLKE